MPDTTPSPDAQTASCVYYFDGTNGCDYCQGLTGFSFTPPRRPHPHCDCPIEVYHLGEPASTTQLVGPDDLATAYAALDGNGNDTAAASALLTSGCGGAMVLKQCHNIIKNVQRRVLSPQQSTIHTVNNCKQKARTLVFNLTRVRQEQYGHTLLKQAVVQHGWNQPPTGIQSSSISIGANVLQDVDVTVWTHVAYFSGDIYLRCQGQLDQFVRTVSGSYQETYGIGCFWGSTRRCP